MSNVNIYAAESLDRYHVQRLDVSFDDLPLTELSKEMVTLDETTAFHHAWILIIKPLLENLCLEEAKKVRLALTRRISGEMRLI